MRTDSHPLEFYAREAITDRAQVALMVWETGEGFKWRSTPHGSLAVLIGLHDVLGQIIDAPQERKGEGDEDAD